MCCAQTGSGKTCAFLFPILSLMDLNQAVEASDTVYEGPGAPQAVILAPTRELCSQIHLEARKMTFKSPIRPVEVYGGMDARQQLRDLAKGVDVLTATPGRCTDFIDH